MSTSSPATSSQATASQATPDVNTIASNHITTSTSPATSSQATALAAELQSNYGDSDSDSDRDKPDDGKVWTQEQFDKWVKSKPDWKAIEAVQKKKQEKWLKRMRKELAKAKEARKAPERSESDLKNSNID
jgi:hypothetical protein